VSLLYPKARKLLHLGIVLLGCCAVVATSVRADPPLDPAREYGIKAAFLYNFTKFVGWPSSDQNSDPGFRICVDASPDVVGIIRTALASKRAKGAAVSVSLLEEAERERIRECHLVFVAEPRRDRLSTWNQLGVASGVLIVSEADRFGDPIGMINLVAHENRVQLEVERATTESAGLMLSSSLLSLARLREDNAQLPAKEAAP